MDEVFTFDKNYSQRCEEYYFIFDDKTILSASHLKKQWSRYMELCVNLLKWQAVWKIPRQICETMKIPFPTLVLVLVIDIDFNELEALVRVLAVRDDDIMIPEYHHVPLIQLWPTKLQDKNVTSNIAEIANALDVLRFFYLYLFMPWDMEEELNTDWVSNHLESRLRLHFDMKNNIISHADAQYIHTLLTEAQRLQYKVDDIESKLRDIDEESDDLKDSQVNDAELEEQLLEIHVRMMEIRTEIDILENPALREIKLNKNIDLIASSRNNNELHVWAILLETGTADEYIKFAQEVKKYFPKQTLLFATNLADVLESANFNDIFLLNESRHEIRSSGTLEAGATLIGIGCKEKIILTSQNENVMLDLGNAMIENVTIDSMSEQYTIFVSKGKCTLKNCKITGHRSKAAAASAQHGLILHSGAELELINCEISGFNTAIVGNSGSVVSMNNCLIHFVEIGVKIFDRCKTKMHKVDLRDCSEYAVVLETDNHVDVENQQESLIGNFEILEIIPEVSLNSVNGTNNSKGNVAINHKKNKLQPVEDYIANLECYQENSNCDTTLVDAI